MPRVSTALIIANEYNIFFHNLFFNNDLPTENKVDALTLERRLLSSVAMTPLPRTRCNSKNYNWATT